jgi:hypothetical protein
MPVLETKSIEEFITRYQVDGVLWKADKLLSNIDNAILRNDRTQQVATMLSLIPESMGVMRDDYIDKICRAHGIKPKTLERMITEAALAHRKKEVREERKSGKKNKIKTIQGDPRKFPFFREVTKQDKDGMQFLDKIKFDKLEFVQLLSHFGFSRYEPRKDGASGSISEKDEFTFVQLKGNVISSVTRNQIIDFIEKFIRNEYDFESAKYAFTEASSLINAFYDQMKTIFSKDLFARVRTEEPIIINIDKPGTTYLYYQNGFVEITKDGWTLRSYEEMNGSVWEHQMLDRSFTKIEFADEMNLEQNPKAIIENMGFFADFCFRLANEDWTRFASLCSIIGYLMHDFYEYKLKAILLTDSSISDASEGRTGKTLICKMVGMVRSYCEINGKDFDSTSISKYQEATLGTQVLHLNDVKHKGRFKFDFEDVFNDITEGYVVKKLYMPVFRQYSKMIISSNKTLNIQGASQRDRIIEFEVSPFFGEHLSPLEYYGHWFPAGKSRKDWDEKEFARFDNFMCYCSQLFHAQGIIPPAVINLGERKLLNHTSPDFLEYMQEITDNLAEIGLPWQGYEDHQAPSITRPTSYNIQDFKFDKRQLYERFVKTYPDFKNLTQNTFTRKWLQQYSEQRLGIKKPKEFKSNSISYIQFIEDKK